MTSASFFQMFKQATLNAQRQTLNLDVKFRIHVFRHDVAIEEVNDPVAVVGVVGGVRDHDDRRPFFVELLQQLHDLFAIG